MCCDEPTRTPNRSLVIAFTRAIEAHNKFAGLDPNETLSVHLWHMLASALEFADWHTLDFDETLAEVREHFASLQG